MNNVHNLEEINQSHEARGSKKITPFKSKMKEA